MTDQRPILIAGPTASGKSRLALELAERHRGLIINADSMQVYRELAILTARPTVQEMGCVPHALYGHIAAAEAYSVARWLGDVGAALSQARALRLRPIVVGGTGLYFKALLDGLSAVPPIPLDIRAYWRTEATARGAEALHAALAERDPEMAARLSPSDTQRLTRALEVITSTGRSLAQWQREPAVPVLRAEDTERLLVMPARPDLHARCDVRFEAMLAAGAEDEVRALLALGLDPSLPVLGALGVAPLAALMDGRLSRGEAIERAKAETRQYAKRQITWATRYMSAWNMSIT